MERAAGINKNTIVTVKYVLIALSRGIDYITNPYIASDLYYYLSHDVATKKLPVTIVFQPHLRP